MRALGGLVGPPIELYKAVSGWLLVSCWLLVVGGSACGEARIFLDEVAQEA